MERILLLVGDLENQDTMKNVVVYGLSKVPEETIIKLQEIICSWVTHTPNESKSNHTGSHQRKSRRVRVHTRVHLSVCRLRNKRNPDSVILSFASVKR